MRLWHRALAAVRGGTNPFQRCLRPPPPTLARFPALPRRFRNEAALASLPPKQQFAWLHRFYLFLDEVVTRHKVG